MDTAHHDRGTALILNGVLALMLSIVIWRLTGNLLGWAVCAVPGSVLILRGWYLLLRS